MRKIITYIIMILLLLAAGGSTVLLVLSRLQAQREEDISGEWSARLDMTERAAVTALSWLQDIEAVSVSLEDVASYMQDLTIQVNLTLEQTARYKGTFRCAIPQESYDTCREAAYAGFARAFQSVLAERLRMAGYEGSTDEAALEDLAAETFGMPLVSYLMSCGPALLPPLEELQNRYDGSGSYETADGVLIRYYDRGPVPGTSASAPGTSGSVPGTSAAAPDTSAERADAVRERYMKQGPELILYGQMDSGEGGTAALERGGGISPMIYTLRYPGEQ